MSKTKKIINTLHLRLTGSRSTVLGIVEENPKKFFKTLKRFYRHELAFSKTFPKWKKLGFVSRVKDIKSLKLLPAEANEVVNIIKAIDKHFPPEGEIGLGNKTIVEVAKIIHKVYSNRINRYMERKILYKTENYISKYTPEQALLEQQKRGFIPLEQVDMDMNLPYIRSTVDTNYVWPEQYGEGLTVYYDNLKKIGVTGYTGIKLPRKYKK